MLAVTVLGCSGSYAEPGGACTGYLLRSAQTSVWLDAGPGSLANLQRHVSLTELDAIVLTHAHPDHWLEIPVVANALGWYEQRDPVPVYSNQDTADVARGFLGDEVFLGLFSWQVVGPGDEIPIGDQRWTFAEAEHYVPTLATCAESGGHTIAFSADTGPAFSLRPFVDAFGQVDAALVESTFAHRTGNEGILHLAAAEAGALAADAGVGRLLLTHLSPGELADAHLAEAATTYDGPIEVVEVGRVYDAAG